jgi:GMP synthase (glutamine-hydrolysing)
MMRQAIAIIDLGGQYCHMISRRLRDLGVSSEIYSPKVKAEEIADYGGVILSGGPQSVYDHSAPAIDPAILRLHVPVLGICYGHQLLAQQLNARVLPGEEEFGPSELQLKEPDSLFVDTPAIQRVWMSHSDAVVELPHGATLLATTGRCEIAAFADMPRQIFGVQFHPEVSHTAFGQKILENFAYGICHLNRDEGSTHQIERLVNRIRTQVGQKSVFFLVSGGVDSTVAFVLCARALPSDRLLGVYVETGLMRKQETAELRSLLEETGLADRLIIRDESERFLTELVGVIDPEKKRQIIGRLFVDVQSQVMNEYRIDPGHWLLGQGTIYPDTIESGGSTGSAALIKTHHNRCAEVRRLIDAGMVIEPLAEFYKDEVRRLGASLGLSPSITQRWPFPGPGLAIRTLCTSESAQGEVEPIPLNDVESYAAVGLPLRSVGVQGDHRTYRRVVAVDGELDYDKLQKISLALCNVGKAHNRVIFRLAGPRRLQVAKLIPGRTLTRERLDLLRDADFIVRETMMETGLTPNVWQFPVVLIPLTFGKGESVVLRPVESEDGMTASFARLPRDVLYEMASRINRLPGVDAVFLDISDKPPATIEWE